MNTIDATNRTHSEARPESAPVFTASQIAAALGVTAQAIRQELSRVPPETQIIVAGNPADAWRFNQLPATINARLQQTALRCQFRSALDLLCRPDAWRSPVPLAQCTQFQIDKAVKTRAVFQPLLEDEAAYHRGPDRLAQEISVRYQSVFGFTPRPKWLLDLFDKFKNRDGGRHDFANLEIYLEEKTGRKPGPGKPRPDGKYDLKPITDAIAALQDQAAPTGQDRESLFDAAFRHFETLMAANPGQDSAVKTSIIRCLFRAVPLAKSLESLQRTFAAKYKLWVDNGRCPSALEDLRRTQSGNFRTPDFALDKKRIRDTAILHGGNESLACRKLRQAGELSPEFVNYYAFDDRCDKSRVPAAVRQAITPEVEMCGPIHRGSWEAKMRGPYIQRDWSAVRPADWFNADDVTWNSYFWYRDDDGRLQITRGECLLFIDLRTGYPLDFMLIAGKYNGLHIRRAFLRVHDLHGLPHKGNYFERSVWKSRLVIGETNKNLVHWRDAERGLRDYGLDLQVRHATTPRAKPIEGLLRILQESQRNEIGFVGFNERLEKMERTQEIIGRCKRGTEDPRNHFLSQEQWSDRISQLLGQYMHDPQNGKMLDGLSPAEMWQQRDTPRKLPDEARYILATHRVRVAVRQEGIILTIRGKRLAFYSEETGKRIGRDVFAFYNIEQPDLLTVSDLNRQNFFTVKHHTLPAMSATKDQFAAVNADRAGHMKTAKVIYGSIPHPERRFIVRDNMVDEETKPLGRFHNAQTARFQQEEKTVANVRSSRQKRALELLRQSYQETNPQP
jgi:hypothetical protein